MDYKLKKKIIIFSIFLILSQIYAQEVNSEINKTDTLSMDLAPVTEVVFVEDEDTKKDDSIEINSDIPIEEKAIIQDIETSSLSELNIWAKSLGLVTGGSKETLKRSLANYYNIDLPYKSKKNQDRVITVNRAELSQYYTFEEMDESIAEFEGRVEIIIDDQEKEIQHSIIADKVNFNRTLNSVTALGNVEYIKTEKGRPEYVTGESMTFNLSNWKGSLVKCISKQDKTINEENMTFYYVAGEIKKSDTDIMGMKDVTVQTVEGSPYFNISALDLWMLNSSDFLMILPRINVGHVPLFIFPFYYHSENSLYFNPSYGINDRDGMFNHNTIYLMGRKLLSEEESDFSFLSFDNGEGVTNYELNGLTVVPNSEKETYSEDYFKFMVDYYSKLGIFTGIQSEININELKSSVSLDTGVGFSRTINSETGAEFIDGESEWNHSDFYDNEVPYRYNLSLSINTPVVKLDYINLSDPYFKSDFYNREENFQWINYFTDQLNAGFSDDSKSDDSKYDRDTSQFTEITRYDWGVDFSTFSPKIKFINPFLDKLILDPGEIKIDYKSKENKDTLITIDNPAYKFYYPEQITAPVTLKLSGKLYDSDYDYSKNGVFDQNDLYQSDDPIFEIENPAKSNKEKTEDKDQSEDEVFIIINNDKFDNISLSNNSSKIISSSFDYDINLPYRMYGYMDNDEWENINDISYTLENRDILYNFDPTGTLKFNFALLNSFFTINNSLSDQIYKKAYLEDDDQSNLLQIYKWNKNIVTNKLATKIDLFKLFPEISGHGFTLAYYLDEILYKEEFDATNYQEGEKYSDYYKELDFRWNEDFITKNQFDIEYKYSNKLTDTTLGYTHKLEPYDEERSINAKEIVTFSPLGLVDNKSTSFAEYSRVPETSSDDSNGDEEVDNTFNEIYEVTEKYEISLFNIGVSADAGFKYSESFIDEVEDKDEWDYNPISLSLKYNFNDTISLDTSYEYSIEDETWESYKAGLNLWDFSLLVNSRYDYPISWDLENRKWIKDSDVEKELDLDSITFAHDMNIKEYTFWKNRITLDIDSKLQFTKKFLEVDKSAFKYSIKFSFDIYEFLSISFQSVSENKSMFLYWKEDSSELGLNNIRKDIFDDFVKSFNFSSEDDRKYSSFNLNSISVGAIYKMPDWNLVFKYSGKPELEDDKYQWYQVYSFFVEWKPLALVRSNIKNDDDNWTVTTSSEEE